MADVIRIDGHDGTPPTEPDAHGQAAIMLVESMLHALIEARAISTQSALDIVRTAQEAKVEIGKELRERSGNIRRSLQILDDIAESLETDIK